jgi:D-amino-acid dehydrogenase
MKAIIIGAGIVGASSAAALAKRGYDVTVLDTNRQPALGASYANGGQLSACHTTPWANPQAPFKLLKWAFNAVESPLVFRPQADMHQLTWLMKFALNCLPNKTKHNTEALLALALHSREARKGFNIGVDKYNGLNNGILHFYRTKSELRDAERDIKVMNALGLDRRTVTVDEALVIEPALKTIKSQLIGATFTPSDSSGDAAAYTRYLLNPEWAIKRSISGSIRFEQATVSALVKINGKAQVKVYNYNGGYNLLDADVIVVSAGVWSRDLVKSLGIDLNIYPAQGFSATIDLKTSAGKKVRGPHVSLTDDERKLVYSRLGDKLRVAGTAQLAGYSNVIKEKDKLRCENMLLAARSTFGFPEDMSSVEYWSGLRPLTPSNRPYVCSTHLPNLFLNTGHGSLGWTLSAGSADLLAGIVEGTPPINAAPYSLTIPH